MLTLKYIKVDPTTYLMQYQRGKIKRKGKGLALWYYPRTTSLVAVPIGTTDVPFIFKETTGDFQEVSVQGQLVYRINDPEKTASLMNFTLKPEATSNNLLYQTEDLEKLRNRIVNLAQVTMRTAIEQLSLRKALSSTEALVEDVKVAMRSAVMLEELGIEIIDLALTAIKPTPDTARALEAAMREKLLEEADVAIYRRRNASIEQERAVRENELNTELAIEAKQQQIEQRKLEAERGLQEQRRQMQHDQLDADIEQEQQRTNLVELATKNGRKQADAKAYDIAETMQALSKVDARVLEAMTMANLNPEQLLAQAFRDLAGSAQKIGELNIAPDLLRAMTGRREK